MKSEMIDVPIKDLFELFDMQERLDKHITEEKQITFTYEEMLSYKKLALLVEIGEFANEVKAFKYWSNKERSEKEVELEETADVLHFILSVGLLLHYNSNRIPQITINFDSRKVYSKLEITTQTMDVYYYALMGEFSSLLREFVRLVYMLGHSWDDLYEAYLKKNKKNHERQNNGY